MTFQALIRQIEGIQSKNPSASCKDLEDRDRLRSNPHLFVHGDTITSILHSLPSSRDLLKKDEALMNSIIDMEHYLEAIGQLKVMWMSISPFIELYRKVSVQFPLPTEGECPMPHQLAAEAVDHFKINVLNPLLMAKRKLASCRGDISGYLSLRLDVPPSILEEQGKLEAQVQDLVSRFQVAYEVLSSIIRPGFPELRKLIEEIDALCGMGKLRMDVHLDDFSQLSPVNESAPNILRSLTKPSSQVAPKNLKPIYILKKFLADKKHDFYREMEAMRSAKQLDGTPHPNVAELEFAFEEGVGDAVTYYLAMPLYEYGSTPWFSKHLTETGERDAVLRCLAEIAEGLHFLHCNRVIHGDLKPENIMFESDLPTARPKLIDFNFSGIDQKTNALLRVKTAALGASLGYVPPEFSDGRTTSRTQESDVYSLGQTYRVLLGMAPNPSSTVVGKARVQQQENLQKAAKALLGEDVYNQLGKLFQLMTEVAPEKRIRLSRGEHRESGSTAGSNSGSSSVLEVLNLLKAGRVKELSRCPLM